jgi:glyoxylase-like metal-dependent hydrolase (beta-lactamase superfamily II)
MKRRHFLHASAAALLGATSGTPKRLWARDSLALGTARIDMLSDGHLVLPPEFSLGDMPPAEVQDFIARHRLSMDALEPPCNITLLRDGSRNVLFDIGAGPDFMDTAGQLPDALDALGLAPEEITHLVITHAHPDHIWGLLDDFDEPFLPNAEVLIGRREWDYWMDPDTLDSIGAERQSFVVGAQRRLAEIADIVALFDDGAEILPGLRAVETPGHTPGHMAFALESGAGGLMILGDAIANDHIAFERPGQPSTSDQDPDLAAATRLALLDRITAEGMTVAGFHFRGGGLGQVERLGGDSYRFHEGA